MKCIGSNFDALIEFLFDDIISIHNNNFATFVYTDTALNNVQKS